MWTVVMVVIAWIVLTATFYLVVWLFARSDRKKHEQHIPEARARRRT